MSAASISTLQRRAAAGEVNARDELARIGHGTMPGYTLVQRARAAVSKFGLALDSGPDWGLHAEDVKPDLPPGSLAGLHNLATFTQTVLKARQYKDGCVACAIVVASGPALDATQVRKMASALNLSAMQARCFEHAVKFPRDCATLAKSVGPAERNAIAVGQCVGIARLIQAARSPSNMAVVDRVIGYEMGEP